jgi:hypothetical protein
MSPSLSNACTAVFAFIAAATWACAAWTRARPQEKPDEEGWYPAQIIGDDNWDLMETVRRQSSLNALAAAFAALSAVFMGIALFVCTR